MKLAVVLFLVLAGAVAADTLSCKNVLFGNAADWGTVTTQYINGSAEPIPFVPLPNSSSTGLPAVCNYFAGQDVCCTEADLLVIQQSVQAARANLNASSMKINSEEFFTQIIALIGLIFPPTAQMEADVRGLNTTLATLKSSQESCLATLSGYTEGMLCFACAVNASHFINVAEHQVTLQADTCSGVVQACTPVNNAALAVLRQSLTIVSSFFPGFEAEVEESPDMCGGNMSNPGSCPSFMCDVWLQGVSVPRYEWSPDTLNSSTLAAIRTMVRSGQVAAAQAVGRQRLVAHFNALRLPEGPSHGMSLSLAASRPTNVYAATGYPALAVGCADGGSTSCGGQLASTADGGDSKLPVIVGASVGGVVLAAGVLVAVMRGRRAGLTAINGGAEDAALMQQAPKLYTQL